MARKAQADGGRKRSKTDRDAGTQRGRLLGELEELLESIDDEGLLFLVEQATILAHNARVDRLNREVDELRQKQGAGGEPGRTPQTAAAKRAPVGIEQSEDGKVFILVVGGARKVLSREEMRSIVRVCHAAEEEEAGARQLYTVLSKERRDILMDARIADARSPLLAELWREVRSRYRVKEQGAE